MSEAASLRPQGLFNQSPVPATITSFSVPKSFWTAYMLLESTVLNDIPLLSSPTIDIDHLTARHCPPVIATRARRAGKEGAGFALEAGLAMQDSVRAFSCTYAHAHALHAHKHPLRVRIRTPRGVGSLRRCYERGTLPLEKHRRASFAKHISHFHGPATRPQTPRAGDSDPGWNRFNRGTKIKNAVACSSFADEHVHDGGNGAMMVILIVLATFSSQCLALSTSGLPEHSWPTQKQTFRVYRHLHSTGRNHQKIPTPRKQIQFHQFDTSCVRGTPKSRSPPPHFVASAASSRTFLVLRISVHPS
ncbi:hypothetical protein BJ138DRAFT_1106457 [Hygrophoropsis aurantiaca]|uniref:Uncharacterized protein n=1 Tax=Hygrophoropsis aurantiaca TaxID=72124 RepID=A0ACB7ZVZ4_9AGAM|nr:hypothetical protein BJ138DRAFT_1106457 [Hygrophoropsis aurantiaca]